MTTDSSEKPSSKANRTPVTGDSVEQAVSLPFHIVQFAWRVTRRFLVEKKGLMLAGAVAYNALLSLVPLLFLLLVVASHIVDESKLLGIVRRELELLVPTQAASLTEVVQSFLATRDVIGILGTLVLLFLSSIAFRILEDAIAVIFQRPVPAQQPSRAAWVSHLIPYAYMGTIFVLLLALTFVASWVQSSPLAGATGELLYVAGFVGLVALFASFYKVLPVGGVSVLRALIGGGVAAVLWELTRHGLIYYFKHLSLVDVVYGSMATVIVVLVSFEIGAVIVLLGATVIAELEANAAAGLPWYARGAED